MIALVDISNFISPIVADVVLLYNTVLDEMVEGMSSPQLVAASSAPVMLTIGPLVDSIPFVKVRLKPVMSINGEGIEVVHTTTPGRLQLGAKSSQEI